MNDKRQQEQDARLRGAMRRLRRLSRIVSAALKVYQCRVDGEMEKALNHLRAVEREEA